MYRFHTTFLAFLESVRMRSVEQTNVDKEFEICNRRYI